MKQSQQIYGQIFKVSEMLTESYLKLNNIYLLVDFTLHEPFLIVDF